MNYFEGWMIYGDDMYVDDYYDTEKWAIISECPNYYISNKGRVWSRTSQQFIKPKFMDREGHLGVCLMNHGERQYCYIHRLIAEHFIPNPHNYPIVRHLNDIPDDNEIINLAWGTQKDNWNDSVKNGTAQLPRPEWRAIGIEKTRTPILATNIKTGEKIIFKSQGEASRTLELPQSNIWKVLVGSRKHTCGWVFEYVEKGGCYETH